MARTVSIGADDFQYIRNEYFYIDKTGFLKEWWESGDKITLITRPRRFGKTLNMTERFFSNRYENQGKLFEGLSIWKEEKYRKLQGTYPVISISFAKVKENNYKEAKKRIYQIISSLYSQNVFLEKSELLDEREKNFFYSVGNDMQEAYLGGYWKEMVDFMRSLFNSTFKTNTYLERAIMTGITRVGKASMFSDLNNLKVVTTTSEKYACCFGFTEKEVFAALEEFELSDQKEEVKFWYDGFMFGKHADIYNPWSICNFLDTGEFMPYWVNTSSNSLVSRLIQESEPEIIFFQI